MTDESFGLAPEAISRIQTVFAKYPQIRKVVLYGSRALGTFKNGSDIDLTLIGEQVDLTCLLKVENELDDLMLPQKIDLSIHSQIENRKVLEHISQVGKIFYSAS